jgi:adenylate kinase family enzyme
MKRILIIGSGGAGKSTLARQLGDIATARSVRTGTFLWTRGARPQKCPKQNGDCYILQRDVIHLDAKYWQPGWVETPKPEWQAIVEKLLQGDTWIIDGNFSGTLDLRLQAADTVIFLDFSRWLCTWRIIKRRWMYAGRTRPDVGADCPEKLDWEFLQWVWMYRDRSRPAVLEKLKQVQGQKQVIILRSPLEVQNFLQSLTELC